MERFHGVLTTTDGVTAPAELTIGDDQVAVTVHGETVADWRLDTVQADLASAEVVTLRAGDDEVGFETPEADRLIELLAPPSTFSHDIEEAARHGVATVEPSPPPPLTERAVVPPDRERSTGSPLIAVAVVLILALAIVFLWIRLNP